VAGRSFLGNLRLALLVLVLLFVALGAWLDRARVRDWDTGLRVTIYPVAVGGTATAESVARLNAEQFAELPRFMREEARRHGLALDEPLRVRVSHAATAPPPTLPADGGWLRTVFWSLHTRYWAWRVQARDPLPPPDVQVFALYHDPEPARALPDSLGLSKGLVAIANVFALHEASGSNNVVLVHELLHTLGASDKYDPRTGEPTVPQGLGDPAQQPLYPQATGEIMAGRIAVAPGEAVIPGDLRQMRVGTVTAREIGWIE
jgi:hypothetical protein